MNNLIESIKEEWERSILLFLLLALLCFVGYFAYGYLKHDEEDGAVRKAKPSLPHFYDVRLLRPEEVKALAKGVNPMSCVFVKPPRPAWKKAHPFRSQERTTPVSKGQKPAPVKPAPVKPAPVKPAPVKPAPASGGQKTAKPTSARPVAPKPGSAKPAAKRPVSSKPQPKPVAKPRPKVYRTFEFVYVGNMSISGGSSGAQLYVSEMISKKQANRFKARLHQGEKLFDGIFKVVAFDRDKVVLEHSGKQRLTIPMGGKRRVVKEVVDR